MRWLNGHSCGVLQPSATPPPNLPALHASEPRALDFQDNFAHVSPRALEADGVRFHDIDSMKRAFEDLIPSQVRSCCMLCLSMPRFNATLLCMHARAILSDHLSKPTSCRKHWRKLRARQSCAKAFSHPTPGLVRANTRGGAGAKLV